MRECKQKILPSFNKLVIFSTTDFSNHGHPDPIDCPSNISRKSIALYYFSEGRPKEEIFDEDQKNRTHFKNRFGFNNEIKEKRAKKGRRESPVGDCGLDCNSGPDDFYIW